MNMITMEDVVVLFGVESESTKESNMSEGMINLLSDIYN